MHRLHRQRGCRAAQKELGSRKLRRGVKRALVVRGLERPDACLEPGEQRKIVRQTAKEGLTQVNVRLHETWKDERAASVDRCSAAPINRCTSDPGDAPIRD